MQKQFEEHELLRQHRARCFKKMKDAEMPSFRYGLNIRLQPDGFDFTKIIPKLKVNRELAIQYDAASGVTVSSQPDARLLKQFLSEAWDDHHKLYYFHQAFANDFLFICIPSGLELKEPIEISCSVGEFPWIGSIFIMAGANSKAQILLYKTAENNGNSAFMSDEVRVVCGRNSSIDFLTIQDVGKDIINMQSRKALAKNVSAMHWADITIGGKFVKTDIVTRLAQEGASTKITALFIGSDNQRYDLYTAALHQAPHTVSDILTKGVLRDEAKALSRGLIRIEKDAFGSNGYEKQDTLLLSGKAEADAIPNLEIHNHDVKCTHGSTVGQIDKDKLFYLMSRGLDENQAKHTLVEGYFTPVVEIFKNKSVKQRIQAMMSEALG